MLVSFWPVWLPVSSRWHSCGVTLFKPPSDRSSAISLSPTTSLSKETPFSLNSLRASVCFWSLTYPLLSMWIYSLTSPSAYLEIYHLKKFNLIGFCHLPSDPVYFSTGRMVLHVFSVVYFLFSLKSKQAVLKYLQSLKLWGRLSLMLLKFGHDFMNLMWVVKPTHKTQLPHFLWVS